MSPLETDTAAKEASSLPPADRAESLLQARVALEYPGHVATAKTLVGRGFLVLLLAK